MDFRDCLILVQFQKVVFLTLARAKGVLYHIGQAGKPEPLASLSHWLHIVAHGHMVTWSMAAGYWLRVIHWLPGTGCRAPACRATGCRATGCRVPADRGHRVGPTATGPR